VRVGRPPCAPATEVSVQGVSPDTEVRTVLTRDGYDAARRPVFGEGEGANLGFRVRGARGAGGRGGEVGGGEGT
jgi:hypothetical protein